jgi:hypothetical protein
LLCGASSLLIACFGLFASAASHAEIRVDVVLSLTGLGASIGIAECSATLAEREGRA